jgi:hypothetical protein
LRIETAPRIAPAADATPSTARTRCTRRSSSGGGSAKKSVSTLRGTTATSVPVFACAKTSVKERLIVSVKMYVPAIIATPSTTASAVRAVRSGRARRPRSATRLMIRRPS